MIVIKCVAHKITSFVDQLDWLHFGQALMLALSFCVEVERFERSNDDSGICFDLLPLFLLEVVRVKDFSIIKSSLLN